MTPAQVRARVRRRLRKINRLMGNPPGHRVDETIARLVAAWRRRKGKGVRHA